MSKVKRSTESSTPAKKVARVKTSADISEAKKVTKKANTITTESPSTIDDIRRLEAEVYEGKKNFNNIVTILAFCSYEKYTPQEVIAASQALRRIFLALMKTKECTLRTSQITSDKVSEALSKVESWLQTQALKFVHLLVKYIAFATTNDIPDALVIAFIDTLFDIAVQDAHGDASKLVGFDAHSVLVQVNTQSINMRRMSCMDVGIVSGIFVNLTVYLSCFSTARHRDLPQLSLGPCDDTYQDQLDYQI